MTTLNKEKSAEFLQWASQERMRLAFENNVPILLMATLTALCIIGVTVGYHRLDLSIPWFLLLVMVYLSRYRLYLRFVEGGGVGEQAATWRKKFLAGAAAAGVMWGIGLFIVFPEHSIALQMIIMLTAFGIMGVTLVGYSSDVTASLLFNTPVAAILAIRLLALDADHGLTLLLGLAIIYSISVLLSRNLERFAMESLWVKYQNIGLAERLDSAQARLKALAEAAFEGILVCDNGLVIDANDPFIKSFEYDSLQELKGKHVLELVAEEYRPMVAEKIETEASAPYEIEALTNNGNRLHVEIHSKPLPYMDRHVRVSAVRDITERRKAEQQARRRQKLQTGLADARGALIGVEDPIPAFRRIINSLGSAMEADRAYIFQKIHSGPDEADVVSLLVERVEDGIEPYIGHPIYQRFKPRPASAPFSTLGQYKSFKGVVSAMEEYERGIFAARGVASVLIVPIVVSGVVWGGMGFEDCRRPREWTAEEESAMWAIGYNLGMFLERQRSDEERRKLTDAIGQLDEMVVITDLQGRIEYANPVVSAVTGYTMEELTGSNPRLLKSGKHGPEFYTNIWKTLGQGAIWRGRIINKRKNGQLYDEEMTISPMKNSSGQITHYAAIKRDVTEKVRAEQELREAKERAEEATIMKDKFISLVAHDLRSPLASVMGFLAVADNNMDEERKKQVFQRVGSILSGMINMIDDLLDITMLQAGKIKPQLEPLDARAMADLIINEHGDAAGGKGINVVNQIPPGFLIQGDRRLIHEVLRNLFTNAVKFTGQGGLVRFDATDGAIHRIAVKDTGQGIGPELLRELFNGDVKTTTLGTAGEKGSGLGLPLCQEIMKAHGGRIGVNSSPGQGSEFFVILPNSQPAGG